MLELIRHHSKGWIAKIIVTLIVITFGLVGVEQWLGGNPGDFPIAKVDGDEVSLQDYSSRFEAVRKRMQAQAQDFDASILENPLFKQDVLDSLIMERLIDAETSRENFTVSDEQLNTHLLAMPEFQENGHFSQDRYQLVLEQAGMNANKLESNVRNDLIVAQVRNDLAKLSFTPKSIAEETMKYQYQKRDVSTAEISASSFSSEVDVTPEQVKDYYESHKDKLKVPEQVKLEFVLLSTAGFLKDVSVSDEEVKIFYDQNIEKFQGNQQRQASHILIGYGVNPSDEEKLKAKEKIDGIKDQLEAKPELFEELAIKFSEDPITGKKGGSVGNVERGVMEKPFEDAAYSMRVGEISDIVETNWGYHIIRLDSITGESPSFESVKPKIKADLIFQKAQIKYAEHTEEFRNVVYEQSGSLQPVAKAFNLEVQQTGWLSREEGVKYFKNNKKLMEMVFSDEVLKEKRNTAAEEVAPDNMVAARLVEYKPEEPRKFDEVKEALKGAIKLEKSLELAEEKGKAILKKLQNGEEEESIEWIPEVTVDRKTAQGLTEPVMNKVFKINASTLPAYDGFTDADRAYVLVKVSKVINGLGGSDELKSRAYAEYKAALAQEYISAYGQSLKAKADIEINSRLLEGSQQP